jgi:hypothetical protein
MGACELPKFALMGSGALPFEAETYVSDNADKFMNVSI